MVPKSERFEMRLDPEIIDRVDNWRASQGDAPSRAEAIRRLVESGLEASSSRSLKLNNPERLMVWLLAEILKHQKGHQEQNTVNLLQEAIYGGHIWALEWELTGILHGHTDDKRALNLVVDTLDMWWFIERAYNGFSDEEKKRLEAEVGSFGKNPKFPGFDGNHEAEYLGIARFLVKQLKRFEDLDVGSFNSHMPSVDRYRRMIGLFEPMRKNLMGRGLNVEEVITLLKRH